MSKKIEGVGKIHAERIVELIQTGATPEEAAMKVGVPERSLREPWLKEQIAELLQTSYIPADVLRAALRAGRNKAFFQLLKDGLESNDKDLIKLAAEFSKQIGMDPEIGLNQAPQTTVNIDIGEIKDIIESVELGDVIDVKAEHEETENTASDKAPSGGDS